MQHGKAIILKVVTKANVMRMSTTGRDMNVNHRELGALDECCELFREFNLSG